jgi:hypothetical protein
MYKIKFKNKAVKKDIVAFINKETSKKLRLTLNLE